MLKQSLKKSINCIHWKTNLLSGWGPSVAFNPRISASGVLFNIQNRMTKHQYTPVVDHGWQGSQENLNSMQLVLWASSSHNLFALVGHFKLVMLIALVRTEHDLPGPLPIVQVIFKSFLPSKKIYLSWTAARWVLLIFEPGR